MKVKVIKERRQEIWGYCGDLLKDKIYTVEAIEKDYYRIIDESGEDYLYHKSVFEIVEE